MSKPNPVSNHRGEGSGRLEFARGLNAFTFILMLFVLGACTTPSPAEPSAEREIRAALDQQVRQWNVGNLAGFMETYAKSDRTRFASGGDISLGWQTVLDRYRNKYGNRAAMGTLTFSELDVKPLGSNAALAFGRWHLKREGDEPSGLFTLVFHKMPDGWRIVHDHTSAAERK